jgi:hypothetical protein
MTEDQREASDRPEAERYYAQYAPLDAGPGAPRRPLCKRRSTKDRVKVGS